MKKDNMETELEKREEGRGNTSHWVRLLTHKFGKEALHSAVVSEKVNYRFPPSG